MGLEQFVSVENVTALLFILGLTWFLYAKRKEIELQKIIFPILYVVLYRTSLGLRLMQKYGKKYKHQIQFIGMCGVGFAFLGMILVSFSLLKSVWDLLMVPGAISGVQPVLPGLTVPGLGKLHFWHWIISIFVLAVVHEFSHGVMSHAFDVPVKSSGAAIIGVGLPVLPAAFVEPDERSLPKQSDLCKYAVFAAGPLSNIALFIVLSLVMSFVILPLGDAVTEPIGISIEATQNESYPAYHVFENKTTIQMINGQAIRSGDDVTSALECTAPNTDVTFVDIENKSYVVRTIEHPQKAGRGYLGITYSSQPDVRTTNGGWSSVYVWFKELFKWLTALNLFIGVANLIPIGPLDGGQMLRTFLERLYPKPKAHRIGRAISVIFIVIIVGSLLMWLLSAL